MTPKSALLFAAGYGTRMAPLTDELPKPLIKIAGKCLIDHALDALATVELDRIVVNTHYLGDLVSAHLAGSDVAISHEADAPLETGGGLKNALPLLASDPVLTLNTDAVWAGPAPAKFLTSHWRPAEMDALLLLIPRRNALGHGGSGDFLMQPNGSIEPGPGAVYSGLQIVKTGGLDNYPEGAFSMWEIWNDMLNKGTMFGVTYPGNWCDVGRPDSIALAERMLTS